MGVKKCVVCGNRDVFETDEAVSVNIKDVSVEVAGVLHTTCKAC